MESNNGVGTTYTYGNGYGMPTNDKPLEALAEKIDAWREVRLKRNDPVPNDLCLEIAKLARTRPHSRIADRLKMGKATVLKIMKEVGDELPDDLPDEEPIASAPTPSTASDLAAIADYIDHTFTELFERQRLRIDALIASFETLQMRILTLEEQMQMVVASQAESRTSFTALMSALQEAQTQVEGTTTIALESPDGSTLKLEAINGSQEMYALARDFVASMRETKLIEHDKTTKR